MFSGLTVKGKGEESPVRRQAPPQADEAAEQTSAGLFSGMALLSKKAEADDPIQAAKAAALSRSRATKKKKKARRRSSPTKSVRPRARAAPASPASSIGASPGVSLFSGMQVMAPQRAASVEKPRVEDGKAHASEDLDPEPEPLPKAVVGSDDDENENDDDSRGLGDDGDSEDGDYGSFSMGAVESQAPIQEEDTVAHESVAKSEEPSDSAQVSEPVPLEQEEQSTQECAAAEAGDVPPKIDEQEDVVIIDEAESSYAMEFVDLEVKLRQRVFTHMPVDQVDALTRAFRTCEADLVAEHAGSVEELKFIADEQQVLFRSLLANKRKLEQLHREQLQAMDREEFLEAELLGNSMDQVKAAIAAGGEQQEKLKARFSELEEKETSQWEDTARLRTLFAGQLQAIKNVNGTRLEAVVVASQAEAREEEERLQKELAKLDATAAELNREEKAVEESLQGLDDSLKAAAQPFQSEIRKWKGKAEEVHEEITQLLERLRQLEKEKKQFEQKVESLEHEAREAQAPLHPKSRLLLEQKESLAALKQQLQEDMEFQGKDAEDLRLRTAANLEQEEQLRTELAGYQLLADELLEDCGEGEQHREALQGVQKATEDTLAAYAELQASVTTEEHAHAEALRVCSELTGRMVESKAQLTRIRQEIQAVESALPELEASKKLAILVRNFKNAGKVNEELKDLTGRLAILADRLKLAQEEYGQQQEELRKQEQKCERTGRSLECCQQAAAVARLRYLREKQQHLKAVATRLKGLTQELVLAQLAQCKNEVQFLMNTKGHEADADVPVPGKKGETTATEAHPEPQREETRTTECEPAEGQEKTGGEEGTTTARQDRVDTLRKEISQMEQQIIDLVYADEFEAADEAESMRVTLAEELEALEKENSSRLFGAN